MGWQDPLHSKSESKKEGSQSGGRGWRPKHIIHQDGNEDPFAIGFESNLLWQPYNWNPDKAMVHMDTQREGELVDRYINDLLQPFEQSSAHLILLRILIQPLRCSINVKKGHATTTIITFSTRISQIRKQRDEKEDGCFSTKMV